MEGQDLIKTGLGLSLGEGVAGCSLEGVLWAEGVVFLTQRGIARWIFSHGAEHGMVSSTG